ncbi:hypothetical protein [Allorhizobium ampelinum]|uniref:hypothetical protein n=1 Tax=Allorhizobium ampelinum TaxID=3025782 RepID=UPI001303EAA1|nr:hypothetical protein [Allorhizobium ampelinum]NSZ41578.1 hypothetical protein [Agrobacterium vitis]NTA25261.1 hypothetical protein [Allorhizobium ampelinum]
MVIGAVGGLIRCKPQWLDRVEQPNTLCDRSCVTLLTVLADPGAEKVTLGLRAALLIERKHLSAITLIFEVTVSVCCMGFILCSVDWFKARRCTSRCRYPHRYASRVADDGYYAQTDIHKQDKNARTHNYFWMSG